MSIHATLVNLHIGMFTNTRQDRDMTDEITTAKNLGAEAGEWRKRILPRDALVPIQRWVSFCRNMHYRCTSPWDDGYRLISNAGLAAYDQQMAGLKAEYDKLVQAFGEQYAMWCEQAYLMHRTTYDPADYPPWDELKSRFVFRVEHYPVPEASHFNQTLRGLYAAELESTIQARINAAVADTWERVLAPVRHMAETLINPEQVFRDSLVGNIREALDMIPSLICDTRPAFKQAVETIRSQLADLDPDVLRHNLVKRRDAAERAAAIVSRFGALGSNRKISSNPAT